MGWITHYLLVLATLAVSAVALAQPYASPIATGEITHSELNELSGIVASNRYPGHYWVHNDSGDRARLFLIDSTARHRATVEFLGLHARDWEDIASLHMDGQDYLAIGDIGDNKAQYAEIHIHLLEEPALELDGVPVDTVVDMAVRSYSFIYPDGPRDAESLFFDPHTRSLYLVTKRELAVGVYRVGFPSRPNRQGTLTREAQLPLTYVTAADMSANGEELLIKNLLEVHYWRRLPGESLRTMLSRPSIRLPYVPEPQGEAIAFCRDGSGYVTISEQALGMDALLYFYPRN